MSTYLVLLDLPEVEIPSLSEFRGSWPARPQNLLCPPIWEV